MKNLKLLLIGLFGLIGLSSFCSAGKITYNGIAEQYKYNATNFGPLILNSRGGPFDYECCFSNFSGTSSFNNKTINLQFKKKGDSAYTTIKSFNSSVIINNECINGTYNGNYMSDSFYMTLYFPYVGALNSYNTTYSCSFSGDIIFVEEDTNYYLESYINSLNGDNNGTTCDTGTILSGYILESSVNSQYCVNNGLCPSCPVIDQEYCEDNFNLISPTNCPVCSGGVSNRSSLWINNIQHLGASNIYMSIPEEISRDYSYSNSGEIMEVDVEGYNVDYDYINNVVEIQKYKPTDEDFNNIVGILAQYMPIIVIFIGLLFLYKLLKKPFKSKL